MAPQQPNSPQQLIASTLEAAKKHLQQGELAKASALYDRILTVTPNDVRLLFFSGLVCVENKDFPKAIERLTLASKGLPDHPLLTYKLGLALLGVGRQDDACHAFKEAIRLNPDNTEAYYYLGNTLLRQGKGVEAVPHLEKLIKLNPRQPLAHELLSKALRASTRLPLAHYHQRLALFYANKDVDMNTSPAQHTFFLDREKALHTARQGNRVTLQELYTDIQICYHLGAPFSDAPAGLIQVPSLDEQAFKDFFLSSRLNFPNSIDFNPHVENERLLAGRIAMSLDQAHKTRLEETLRLKELCRQTQPEFAPGQPLRVFMSGSYMSPVGLSVVRGLDRGFRNNGCEVLLLIEPNDMELTDEYYRTRQQLDFNPHIVLQVDTLNDAVHPDTFSIMWSHNVNPVIRCYITSGHPLRQRERDLIYAIVKRLEPFLYMGGASKVIHQGSCHDETIFRTFGQERKRKVVFAGASRFKSPLQHRNSEKVIAYMRAMFAVGEPMTEPKLKHISRRFDFSEEVIFWRLWEYVVRDMSVHWLCSLSDDIEVEIYGFFWEHDEIVRPFYKGMLPHGPALAAVYNDALYVLAAHTSDLESQRLVEASACGAIPIVYDCRHRSGEPQGNDSCLWYPTKEELRACLTQRPAMPPHHISKGKTFTHFAKRILTEIDACLSGKQSVPS